MENYSCAFPYYLVYNSLEIARLLTCFYITVTLLVYSPPYPTISFVIITSPFLLNNYPVEKKSIVDIVASSFLTFFSMAKKCCMRENFVDGKVCEM